MKLILAVTIGGAIGATLRYLVSGWVYHALGEQFPWGTLAVNLLGCFLIGLLWQLFEQRTISPPARALILTGGLGAFTTFSTYGLESLNLMRDGETALGMVNLAVSNGAGLFFVYLGFITARLILRMAT